ncbi:hypothetical protein ACIJYE_00935 [Candidatus Pelagibacter bacterium nBUS_30]|uniref:hypothetical protein n=1 Tax=Candidatus Pelagibacter bacterium nBUS_30 TaxID=3374191 RepID=UPI003EBB1A83
MINIIIFTVFFYLLLFSVIGYGIFFRRICFNEANLSDNEGSIYIGFYGLFFITLLSLISSLFVAHNFVFNIFLHVLGILFFVSLSFENKDKYLKNIILISLLLFSALLISKTNDDLSYYHLPFTKYLTEQKIIFGMGHLNHGYNLLSSLFFLNSTFYLPFIKYFSFHFGILFFVVFFNYFLIKEIFSKKNHEIINLLYIFSFAFFNLSFNRLAEHGTDKSGQLLIVILVIKLFQHTCFDKEKFKIKNILFLLPLMAYCISLKTYFLPYVIIGLIIFFMNIKFIVILKKFFFTKSFLSFILLLIFYFTHHFISTGCFISPLPATCFGEKLIWARDINDMINLSIWLEQWAKAGAGPNFRVENVAEYIANLNWISTWIEKYFLVKFLDQLGILFSSFLVVYLLAKNFKYKNIDFLINKKILFFYLMILVIFSIWLLNHPTLRYGGYSIVFLVLSIPMAFLFQIFENRKMLYKNLKFFILFVVVVFNFKNIDRIINEFSRDDIFKFSNFPFYAIKEKDYKAYDFNSNLTIYSAHHCWATPSPCGHVDEKIVVTKKNGYFFINKLK